jgi:hypothetical protein
MRKRPGPERITSIHRQRQSECFDDEIATDRRVVLAPDDFADGRRPDRERRLVQ